MKSSWPKNEPLILRDPDWEYWSKMAVVSLAEATFLSFGHEPDHVFCHCVIENFKPESLFPSNASETMLKRYRLALSAVGQKNGLTKIERHSRSEVPEHMPCLQLAEYGAWARRSGMTLPQQFPVDLGQKTLSSQTSTIIELPYECDFITGLKRVMWENFTNIDAKNPPKKYLVAKDIMKVLPNVNERIAQSLASWISPQSHDGK